MTYRHRSRRRSRRSEIANSSSTNVMVTTMRDRERSVVGALGELQQVTETATGSDELADDGTRERKAHGNLKVSEVHLAVEVGDRRCQGRGAGVARFPLSCHRVESKKQGHVI